MSNIENLSSEKIQQYIDLVAAEGIDAVPAIYSALNSMGFGYAGWCYGVATGDTITGMGALDYMSATREDHELPLLNIFEINNIRVGMFQGYLDVLKNNGYTNTEMLNG